jgi:hypothetical protein
MNQSFLKVALPHLIALISFIAVSVMYFYPQLEGKGIRSSDTILFKGMAKEALDYEKETGETALWTNSMFGGMPTYQITAPNSNNIFRQIQRVLYMGFSRPISYFIFGSISCYLMLLLMRINPWLSIPMSIGFSFMTNHIVLFEAGHMSKIIAVMSSPLIVGGLYAMFRNRIMIGGLAFTLGLGLNIGANHIQMTYYLALLLAIYFVFEAIQLLKNGNKKLLGKIIVVSALGCLIALGGSASKMLPTIEYSEDTMRGAPILESTGTPTTSSETDGLDFNYAMVWSNGFLDLFSSFIPGVVGGGSSEKISSDSEFAKGVRKLGSRTDVGPLYWGSLPGTSGPVYFGMMFFFLMVFGFFGLKSPLKWWMIIAVFLTLLLSMGKNLEGLNKFIFNYIPLYNKFRTPNSILSVTAVIIPVLGALVLQSLFNAEDKKTYLKPLLLASGVMGFICLFFAFIGPGFFDFVGNGDSNYANSGLDTALIEDRKSLMRMDSLRSLLLMIVTAGGIYLFIKDKLSKSLLIGLIAVLILFDQIGVARRYLDSKSFLQNTRISSEFTPRPVDTQLLSDPDPHFRVFDQTINTFNDSRSSYFHKTIGGAHAAKLQRIQDLIERHISQGNMQVFNMLNTKYFIQPGNENNPEARQNPGALGNAWFVNSIRLVNNANEEIDALNGFVAAEEAIVHQEFADYVNGLNPVNNGDIKLVEYSPNQLRYESNTSSEQLAVFSEMWYGPNKGWQAYIDGKPVEHIRVNYGLRALRTPPGKHTVTFIFDPGVYKTGNIISLISSILFLLLAIAAIGFWYKNRTSNSAEVVTEFVAKKPKEIIQEKVVAKKESSAKKKKKSTKKRKKDSQ